MGLSNKFTVRRLKNSKSTKSKSQEKAKSVLSGDRLDDDQRLLMESGINPKLIQINSSTVRDKELFRLKAVWPFDFFPNELLIREKSVSVIQRYFIVSNIETILVKDIGLVTINDGLILAALIISYKAPHEDLQISKLPRSKAYQAKALLNKLMIAENSPAGKEKELENDFLLSDTGLEMAPA
jgi:hypothetical protein